MACTDIANGLVDGGLVREVREVMSDDVEEDDGEGVVERGLAEDAILEDGRRVHLTEHGEGRHRVGWRDQRGKEVALAEGERRDDPVA